MPSDKTRAMVRAALQRDGWIEGGMPYNHINASEYQAGGRASRSGGIYGAERQIHRNHIDAQNRRVWPSGAEMSSRHKRQRIGVKGGVEGSNGSGPDKGWYSAGHGRAKG